MKAFEIDRQIFVHMNINSYYCKKKQPYQFVLSFVPLFKVTNYLSNTLLIHCMDSNSEISIKPQESKDIYNKDYITQSQHSISGAQKFKFEEQSLFKCNLANLTLLSTNNSDNLNIFRKNMNSNLKEEIISIDIIKKEMNQNESDYGSFMLRDKALSIIRTFEIILYMKYAIVNQKPYEITISTLFFV